jgi:hypothetical protein
LTANVASAEPPRRGNSGLFASHHPWDHRFLLANVALISVSMVAGFGPEIRQRLQANEPSYPLMVHVHAVAFCAWLVLLATQILLIGVHRLDIHRRLGVAGACLAAVMLVLGVGVSFVVGRIDLAGPNPDPAFLFIRLADMVSFGSLASAAILARRQPSTHKRLILLATLQVSDAGFSRWLEPMSDAWFSAGFWPTMAAIYLCNDLLVLCLGLYDLTTRKRLHPAYLFGSACIFGSQMIAVSIYRAPSWKPIAVRLLGG